MSQQSSLSKVEKFDTTGIPSKRSLIIKQIVVFVLPGFLGLAIAIRGCIEPSSMPVWSLWVFGIVFIWFMVGVFCQKSIEGQYNQLYKTVQRGVVTERDPENTRLKLNGYTGANVRVEQWTHVKPAVWHNAKLGDIINLT